MKRKLVYVRFDYETLIGTLEQDSELTFAGYVIDLLATVLIVEDRSHPRLNPIAHGFVQIIEILYLLLAAAIPVCLGGGGGNSYFPLPTF